MHATSPRLPRSSVKAAAKKNCASLAFSPTTQAVRDLFVACELARARSARAWGRSPVELSALIHIYLAADVTPHAIASRLTLTTGSVTALLDRLQAANLIERTANPNDRRSLLIVGTRAGRRLAEDFLSALDRVVGEAVDGLAAPVREQIGQMLRQVVAGMDAHEAAPLSDPAGAENGYVA